MSRTKIVSGSLLAVAIASLLSGCAGGPPLSPKQARYISVPQEGPYKPQTYRY